MKTKKILSVTLALLCACATPSFAQLNLNALKNKAVNAAKNAAKNAAEKAVDNAVDNVVNGTSNQVPDNTQTVQQTSPADAPSAGDREANEALAKYLSYKEQIKSAISNKDLDFLLSDTFQKEIPSLVATVKTSSRSDVRSQVDWWENYQKDATNALYSLTTKAPSSSEYLPRLKYYVEKAEACTGDASKAFWLDRAMSSCKLLGDIDFIVKNSDELRICWDKVRAMYDTLGDKYKRKDADYRNDQIYPEQIVSLQTNLPDFDTQYKATKAKLDEQAAHANAAHVKGSISKPATSTNTSSSSNTVKVKEVKANGSEYDIYGTNNSKIGRIRKSTGSSTDYTIIDSRSQFAGEIRKNNGHSGYSIYKKGSRIGEISNLDFLKAAKMILE